MLTTDLFPNNGKIWGDRDMNDSFSFDGLIRPNELPFLANKPKSTVDRWFLSGALEGVKIGGKWHTKPEWVEAFLMAGHNRRVGEVGHNSDPKKP